MRLGILSDVHGNLQALEAALARLRRESVDAYLLLGDLVMVGPRPRETFELLESLESLLWLKGNTEAWLDEIGPGFRPASPREEECARMKAYAEERLPARAIERLRASPVSAELRLGGYRLLCCHGAPESPSRALLASGGAGPFEELARERAFDCLLAGHSHVPMNVHAAGRRFANLGSVSLPASGEARAFFGLLDTERGRDLQFLGEPFDLAAYERDVRQSGFPSPSSALGRYGRG